MDQRDPNSVAPLEYAAHGRLKPMPPTDDPRIGRGVTIAMSMIVLAPFIVGAAVVMVLLILQ